jgi:DNA-dependent RNA polymerase auxiliary subunit epsilon
VEPSYRSDHSIILELEFNPFIREKICGSLLYDIDYINMVKEKFLDVKKQYSALVYNFDEIDNVSNEDIHFTINGQLLLETLLMEICGKTISYSSYKKKQKMKNKKYD